MTDLQRIDDKGLFKVYHLTKFEDLFDRPLRSCKVLMMFF